MSLAAYLAKNYLSADTPERPKKKRKKSKHQETAADSQDGLIIADDDPPDLRTTTASSTSSSRRKLRGGYLAGGDNDDDDDDDDDEGYTIANAPTSAGFRKSKSKWQTVEGPSKSQQQQEEEAASKAENDETDAILASAAAEREAAANPDDDAPLIVPKDDDDDDDDDRPVMESGARPGLQTASQTAAMMEAKRAARKKESSKLSSGPSALDSQTIYRDASGRIINVAMARAEARKAAEAKAAEEQAEKEALTGDVQRREREARKSALDEAKFIPLARGAEDEEMNRELKERTRWADPAAEFLTSTRDDTAGQSSKKSYKGAAQPNRYGIRPGHRWDGVDRGNGFERKWFETRNKRDRNEELSYAWQMDE